MTESRPPINATVWAVRGGVVLACFTAVVDAEGRILRTNLGEAPDHDDVPDRDQEVRERLRRRYGAGLDVRIVRDGGAGYARFRRDLAAQRRPRAPRRRSPPSQPGQRPVSA
jgi:hypothetical protein